MRGLERQLRALRGLTNIVPLGWALQALSDGLALPRRALSITFDDGYRDNLTLAVPLLRTLQIPATCFLVPGILSNDVVPWWERLAWAFSEAQADHVEFEQQRVTLGGAAGRYAMFQTVSEQLKRRDRRHRESAVDELVVKLAPSGQYRPQDQFLDWDGARELQKHMEIGSHSMYHSILSQETARAQREDLAHSRRQLAEELNVDIRLLAYPNGRKADYNVDTFAAAEHACYTYALTTRYGWNTRSTDRYEIRRWVIRPERGVVELGKILRDMALLRGVGDGVT
jgi:peptidoglycan/xylan/chitin deacetylase (PgdA/CDA1 family)